MNILNKIVQHKRGEVLTRQAQTSIQDLQDFEFYNRACISMKDSILNGSGVIAEFKRKSPSKGIINDSDQPESIAKLYEGAGVSGMSVLTDEEFFGGNTEDFLKVRKEVSIPLLRKDFIIDSYQIHEAKAMGADVILLIARILTPDLTREFTEIAHGLGMEVLLETHSEKEIQEHFYTDIDMIGINNRDLDTFEVDIENSIRLANQLPDKTVKIAESGIQSVETAIKLKQNGFQGLLMGEFFMKSGNPGKSCMEFIQNLKPIYHED